MQAQPAIPYILTFLGIYFLVWTSAVMLQVIVWRRLKNLNLAPPRFFDAGMRNSLKRMHYLLSGEYKGLPDEKLINLCHWLRRAYLAIFAFMGFAVLSGACVALVIVSQQKG